ncbi:tripartite ATP-independent transporter DctP family solute receptor [Flavimobilis soli]|uniref:Tripartite ATP-independent transporter DctP family solute receptor n=1 Tax=Flavimobilis soli TaxID=442709 RepID=A0A2A9EEC7_9MICO|nr:TRAP transporter substrate-binding protein [Flavimobilis soli]PFG36580.1 tripartite ATP-independent transporter DctP family solute receptor [Flavimobilis soli]
MRRNKVVSLIAAAGIATLGLTACSSSDDSSSDSGSTKTFKVAFNQNSAHPQAKAIAEIGEKLKEQTGGKYALELFPDELLGAQAETIEMVQSGSVEMAIVGGSLLENFNPDFAVVNLPYLYESAEHQMKVLNDPEIVGDLYSSMDDKNIHVLASYHGGIRNVYTTKGPVTTPADLKGQKIRVIGSDTNVRMMELMGGVGTPMAQGEVYTAIQSGVLDGAENNELIYSDLAHAEIAGFYSYTKHLMMPDTLIINPKVLADMDEESRKVLTDAVAASVDTELSLFQEGVEAAKAKAEAAGAKFNDADVEAFRTAVLPLHEERLTTDVTKAIYDKIEAAR